MPPASALPINAKTDNANTEPPADVPDATPSVPPPRPELSTLVDDDEAVNPPRPPTSAVAAVTAMIAKELEAEARNEPPT
jgi:hypothetical protein